MAGIRKYQDPVVGDVTIRKSDKARRMSIKVHPIHGITVTVPAVVPYKVAECFLVLKRNWVVKTIVKQKEKYGNVQGLSRGEADKLRQSAKAELPPRLAELADRYGFSYNRVTIKHNATNWGSCSTKSNINLNLNIVRLPAVLQDYVLLHELCHLRHHDHGHAFHLLLEHVLTDNILKLVEAGDSLASEFARKAASSKAKYPLDYVLTRAIKQYRVL